MSRINAARPLKLLPVFIGVLVLGLLFPHSIARAASAAPVDAAAGTGHISGKLLNGSHNNAPVANQSVTLQLAEDNTARDLITITTDAQGNYAFSALESDSSVQYAIYTYYQNAQYVSDLIDLSKNANQQVNLTVYDASTSTENIAVVQATILLDKPNAQTGMLSVSEDFFFENLNNTTYVGKLDASHGKPNALIFTLPTGAKLLSLGAGFDGYNSIQVDGGFASNAAILPGTSRFSFSFQVPYSGTSYQFTYKTVYPTVALSLLTPTTILTTPQGLTSQGPTNTQSGTYDMFQAKTLGAGKSVQARLDGLPTPSKAAAQQPSSLNANLIWLVVLLIVLLALVGVGGYLYNTRRQRAASARRRGSTAARKGTPAAPATRKKTAVPATKEALLQEMLELDKAFEAHRLKKAAYQEQRARLKARLRELISEQEEQAKSRTSEKGPEARGKAVRSSGKGEK